MESKQQSTKVEQIACPNCNTHRLQLLIITQLKSKTQLELLCLDCGMVCYLLLSGEEVTTPREITKTKPRNYTG